MFPDVHGAIIYNNNKKKNQKPPPYPTIWKIDYFMVYLLNGIL